MHDALGRPGSAGGVQDVQRIVEHHLLEMDLRGRFAEFLEAFSVTEPGQLRERAQIAHYRHAFDARHPRMSWLMPGRHSNVLPP